MPQTEWKKIFRWSFVMHNRSAFPESEREQEGQKLTAFLTQVMQRRKEEPGSDLASAMIHHGSLSDEEIVGALAMMSIAGNELLAGFLAGGVHTILTHPAARAAVPNEGPLPKRLVEELLRYDALQVFALPAYRARGHHEIGGVALKPGDTVLACLTSANRDPRIFDRPGHFDPDRAENPHLAFGHGAHYCAGAFLARLVGEEFFPRFFKRWPNAQGRDVHHVAWGMDDFTVRRIHNLTVALG
ncbi:MAG: cytochrome P450 [Myxococcales bacterium]|nr:cytochrome P450 [Myxococcales bacterium]